MNLHKLENFHEVERTPTPPEKGIEISTLYFKFLDKETLQ